MTGPLTSLQEGMLFHALSSATPGVDVEHVVFSVDDDLDVDRFQQAWMAAVSAFTSLRSGVVTEAGQPVRGVYAPTSDALPVTITDWSTLSPEALGVALQQLQADDRAQGFDVRAYPLQRLHLVRRGPQSWWGLWSFHHLILDGRSFPLVLRAVLNQYLHGAQPTEVGAFSASVDHLQAIDFGKHADHWREQMAGVNPTTPLTLGVDVDGAGANPSPEVPPQSDQADIANQTTQPADTGRAAAIQGVAVNQLDRSTTASLRSITTNAPFTLNNLTQAAWALLLHRYQGRSDVVFGSTRACRHICPEAAEAVGLLINTVPFRLDIDRRQSVRSLVESAALRHRSLREVETTPLALVQQWAGLQPGAELFDTLLMFDEASLTSRMADIDPRWHFEYFGQTNYPLTMLVYGDDELSARFEYDRRRISPEAAQRLVAQYLLILEGLAADLDRPVGEVEYLTPEDAELLQRFNATDTGYEQGVTLVDLLDRQASITPDQPAITFGDATLTYAGFRDQANQLAHHLTTLGVGRGSVVGVYAKRSDEMLLAIHAIVRAGGAYLPLDPDLPTNRLAMMIEDAEANLVITAGTVDQESATGLGVATVAVAEGLAAAQNHGCPSSTPTDSPRPDDAAYVIFTSGSTGRPKGVVNEHQGIVNRLQWMQEAFGLTDQDVVLQKTPFSFDVSVWELFWPLLTGAHLAIAPPDDHRDPARLAAQIHHHGVTTIHFVPSMLAAFVDQLGRPETDSLVRVICSGEALTRDLQDRVFSLQEVELHNLYGPTEAAVDVTWWQCDPASSLPIVPIGYPIANTRMHVLDEELQPTPPGAVGELFIEGIQVARGYIARPELTAERFLAPGVLPAAHHRLYRTGDLGRHRPDGALEYLGRTDHQVKIRGLRIELGEIEAALMSHPAVSNCAVVVGDQGPANGQLVAYVLAHADGASSAGSDDETLRTHLLESLPDYMVPTFFVPLATMPLTTSGKIDRKQLPAPTFEIDLTVDPPQGEQETAIAAIWAALIGHNTFGRTTPFFEAGGHSLLLIRLAVELSSRFERQIEVAELVNAATIAAQKTLVSGPDATDQLATMADKVADKAKQRANARKRRARRRG